jgi:hypothetical protein
MGNFKRKHTGDVQEFTPKTIEEYINTAGETFLEMQKQRDRMKEIQLSKRVQAELLGRMYIEEGFIESTQLNIIKRELMKPSFDYGAPNSLWEMYQFTTFSMRDIHPSEWMKDHLAANSFFVRESGIIVPQTTIIKLNEIPEDPNQMSIYDVQGTEVITEIAPEEVENIPMASKDCFKSTEVHDDVIEVGEIPVPEIVEQPLVIPREDELDVKPVEDPSGTITGTATTEYQDLQ